jgi:hypothetical protein
MKIDAIITGSTGMVGKGVLLECLDHDDVNSVLVINRRSVGINHPKLREILHQDFTDLSDVEYELKGYNACFFCLGVTSAGMEEDKYSKLTYDLTIYFAELFNKLNENATFCYVSGQGTDSTERGNAMWARVKGKTENDLLKMPFNNAFMFRPGLIVPRRGVKSTVRAFNVFYVIVSPFLALLQLFGVKFIDTVIIGKAMINSVSKNREKRVLEVKDIMEMSRLGE